MKLLYKNLSFNHAKNSSGNLDKLDIKFAATPIKDSTKVAVIKAKVLVENGNLNLGDSLMARLKFVDAQINVEPDKLDQKIPIVHSVFQIDSTGVESKGRSLLFQKEPMN